MVDTKRKASEFEVGCAKIIREIGCKNPIRSKYTYWMQECYFDIQDNGVDDDTLRKMAHMLKLHGDDRQKAMAERLYSAERSISTSYGYENLYSAIPHIISTSLLSEKPYFEQEDVMSVIDMICRELHVNVDDVLTKSRKRPLPLIRAMVAKLFEGRVHETLMAEYLGGKDRTSIYHYLESFDAIMETDSRSSYVYKLIKQRTGL